MHNFESLVQIGKGGMGLVFRAWDPGLERHVAIKFMDENLIEDEVCVERFLREARVLARIDHPNVVRVLGAGRDERGRPYFVMEYVDGTPLSTRIKQGPIPEAEAVDVACQTLQALAQAHSHGITHRDIKSSNILLCPGGLVKLIDFGISRDDKASSVTSTGKIIGTPAYMSPEQALGQNAGPKSDLYSLGIVIYEMLVGEVPFRAETPVVILRMHTDHPPPALPGFVSPKLRSVVAWALEKRPERRISSAEAMLQELITFKPQAKASATRQKSAVAVSSREDETPEVTTTDAGGGRASRRLAITSVVAVILIVAVGLGFALQPWKSSAPIIEMSDPKVDLELPAVKVLTDDPAYDWSPAWGPNGQIVFVSARNGNPDIYMMDADGSNCAQLTNNPSNEYGPSAGPDGRIVFQSDRTGSAEIFIMDADGQNVRRLTRNKASDSNPCWGPDGRIVFASDREGQWDLYVMNSDGAAQTRLTHDPAYDSSPSWGADGMIAFVSNRDRNAEIYSINPDGKNERRLTFHPAEDTEPTVCLDGRIAFQSQRDDNWEIYVMDQAGSNVRRLTNDPGKDEFPNWGGSNMIAFAKWRAGSYDICKLQAPTK